MKRGLRLYQDPRFDAASPQEAEIVAFTLCNKEMEEAEAPEARVRALYKTHQMWSLIVKDVAKEANLLPGPLKQSIATIGAWVMAYSIAAMAKDLPLEPLIQVNRDMIEGLRGQAHRAAPATPRMPARPPGMISA